MIYTLAHLHIACTPFASPPLRFLRVKRRRPYGMLTFTRKKRLAELVDAQLSVTLALPRIVSPERGAEILRHSRYLGCPTAAAATASVRNKMQIRCGHEVAKTTSTTQENNSLLTHSSKCHAWRMDRPHAGNVRHVRICRGQIEEVMPGCNFGSNQN